MPVLRQKQLDKPKNKINLICLNVCICILIQNKNICIHIDYALIQKIYTHISICPKFTTTYI